MLGLSNNLIHDKFIKSSDGNAPINIITPIISGTASVENVLTSTTGTWTSDTGIIGYLYQWTRDGVNISGATSSTYILITADLGKTIICKVAAIDLDGISSYVNSNNLIIYDADYQAVLERALTLGFTLPDDEEKLIQNQLMIDLKSAGAYAKADLILVPATNSNSDFGRIDWKNPTRLATLFNAPTFIAGKGLQGNGSSAYIDTNFNAFMHGVNYQQNNASRYIFMNTASGTGALDGKSVASINNMTRASTGNQRINQGAIGVTGGSFDFTAIKGMKSIHRTSSTNVELFNGTTQGSRTATSASTNSNNQLILRSGLTYGAHIISFYMNGASMVAENTAIVNAVNTYLNSL